MAPKIKISPGALRVVEQKIDQIFDKLKARAFGPAGGRRLLIGYERPLSLTGIYERAVSEEGGTVDTETIQRLIDITNDLLDKHKSDAKAHVKKKLQDFVQDVESGRLARRDLRTALEGELSDIWGRVTHSVKRVVETEVQHAQTIGIKQGIDVINASLGVQDPVVFFAPVKDKDLCPECRTLHLLPDGVTPRVWLSSEVKSAYHKRGDPQPSWSGLHPHCRCTLTTLISGYGFDAAGRVIFKGADWRELASQRD